MIYLFLFLMPNISFSSTFSDGVENMKKLRERAEHLLLRGGFTLQENIKNQTENSPKNILQVHNYPQDFFIPAGALTYGKNHFRLLVGSEPSPAQIIFSNSNKYQFLCGLKLLGIATQNKDRIFMEFDRLILRSGKTIPIKATLLDIYGSLGVKGKKQNSKLLEVAGEAALGILDNSKNEQENFGFAQKESSKSTKDRIKISLLQESKDYLQEELKEKPVLLLEEETPVTILFKEELQL